MLWYLKLKFYLIKYYYKFTGKTHTRDLSKRDPYIYEE